MLKKLNGVVVPMVCPFSEDGGVDYGTVEKLTDFLIEKGVHALYPCGTTGEMLLLSVNERKKILETVLGRANKRLPVFAHVGAMNLEDTVALATHACEYGADGIGVVTPSFFKISDDSLVEYYHRILDNLPDDFPVYLYSIPQYSTNDIVPRVMERIACGHKNVVGIKYSYPDMQRINDYIALEDGRFSVLVGPDDLFFLTLCAGADGVVSGNANTMPEHFVAIYDAFVKQDYELARKLQQQANRLCKVLNESDNIASYKYALKLRGIDCGGMRSPMRPITKQREMNLQKALAELDFPMHL